MKTYTRAEWAQEAETLEEPCNAFALTYTPIDGTRINVKLVGADFTDQNTTPNSSPMYLETGIIYPMNGIYFSAGISDGAFILLW